MKQLSEFEKTAKRGGAKEKAGIKAIPKLDDANWAGGPKSQECTLIITEGDSAKVHFRIVFLSLLLTYLFSLWQYQDCLW